jgi:hypothetical protein
MSVHKKRHSGMSLTERVAFLSNLGLPTVPYGEIPRTDLVSALRPLDRDQQFDVVEQLRRNRQITAEVAYELTGAVL